MAAAKAALSSLIARGVRPEAVFPLIAHDLAAIPGPHRPARKNWLTLRYRRRADLPEGVLTPDRRAEVR